LPRSARSTRSHLGRRHHGNPDPDPASDPDSDAVPAADPDPGPAVAASDPDADAGPQARQTADADPGQETGQAPDPHAGKETGQAPDADAVAVRRGQAAVHGAGSAGAAPELGDDWRRWIAENKLAGFDDEPLVAAMVEAGFDAAVAAAEVAAVAAHPCFKAGEKLAQRLAKLGSVLDVHRALAALAPGAGSVERRDRVSRDELLERYYAANRPVVLTGAMDDWPALARWGPEYFKATCGEALVEIMSGRTRDPRYEINAYDHKREVRFADYVEMVAAGGESNDYYLVANNGFFGRPEMRPLYDDIRFPEHLDPVQTDGRVHFWFGPAGTVTPLHHDLMNVLMAQVYGRKRVTLISPDQTHRLYNEIGVFSEVDPEAPDYDRHPLFHDVEALRVDLGSGEALFLPVGWWHHVRALDVSVTVTFTNFVHRNEFEWLNPDGQ
jgi:cupin-like protein